MRTLAAAAILSLGAMVAAPVGAQTVDTVGPHNPYCGSWSAGAWTPNGNCVEETVTTVSTTAPAPVDKYTHQRVVGTITSVSGHLVTVQQSSQSLVINDSPALDKEMTGRVAVGRQVVAHGYWDGGTFYATRIE